MFNSVATEVDPILEKEDTRCLRYSGSFTNIVQLKLLLEPEWLFFTITENHLCRCLWMRGSSSAYDFNPDQVNLVLVNSSMESVETIIRISTL